MGAFDEEIVGGPTLITDPLDHARNFRSTRLRPDLPGLVTLPFIGRQFL